MELFSERYGYKKFNPDLNYEKMTRDLKTRLWNVFYKYYREESRENHEFLSTVWGEFLKLDISISPPSVASWLAYIQPVFYKLFWNEVYDLIQFVYNESDIKEIWEKEINRVLQQERVPYRFINGIITPITNEEEIKEITKVLSYSDKFNPAREHLEKALKLLSDRTNPDYENSIKESISALESLAKIILNNQNGTFENLLPKLDLHPALKEGLKKLYAWTGDEGGLRHGNKPDSADKEFFDEARFMLIFCSACFNYLVSKYGKNHVNKT